jgi:hypothetical protein
MGTNEHFSRGGVKLKPRDNTGDLVSPGPHYDAVVRPKERTAAILAQVDREMTRIKDRDHHWEDGIEVSRLRRHYRQLYSHPCRIRINPSPSLKPSATSSGSRHHQSPARMRSLPFHSGAPFVYVVAAEVSYV